MERDTLSPTVEKTCPTCGRTTVDWSEHALTGEQLRRIGQVAVNQMAVIQAERQRERRQQRADQEMDS